MGIFATLMSVQGTFPVAVRAAEEKAYIYRLENPESEDDSSENEEPDNNVSDGADPTPVPTVEPEPSVEPVPSATPVPSVEPEETGEQEVPEEKSTDVEQTEPIEISTYEELQHLGTGETYNEIVYLSDAQYTITEDIVLPAGEIWTLPDGFTGSVIPESTSEDPLLFDVQNNTIYLYHPFQLAVASSKDRANEPVMDGDAIADTFGMGKLIYPDGEDQPYLTYSADHQYVISKEFSTDVSISTYDNVLNDDLQGSKGTYDGRDFPGQVIKEVAGKEYILIGNEDQLRAIGTNKQVYPAIYNTTVSGLNNDLFWPGDADLSETFNGVRDYSFSDDAREGVIAQKNYVDQKTGELQTIWTQATISDKFPKYSADADYIIFRDIDLNNEEWSPLTFSGEMLGAKSAPDGKSDLWVNGDGGISSAISINTEAEQPIISNINIIQDTPIEVDKQLGVGFFSTISSELNLDNIGISGGQSIVSNIKLDTITVKTVTSEAENPQTLLSALTSGLGWLVGGLVDILVGALTFGQVNLNLHDTLSGLLNARHEEPSKFATGAFAGRIEGDVLVEDCVVQNAVVENQNNYTGGFVGYSEGMTRYDGLSSVLGISEKALASLLNAIPGLGLGDLITILLDNALPIGSLIPTGYYNPVIRNCAVTNLNNNSSSVGTSSTSFNGGFIGAQIGTRIEKCSITGNGYTVNAQEYGGGFAGLSRDAEIEGLLSSVGIELVRVAQPQSLLLECSIDTAGVNVNGKSFLGGFTGAMANSYAINDSIDATLDVKGSADGNYVGGFTGNATIGWVSNLGSGEKTDSSLLTTVRDLLTDLLSSNPEQSGMLLSLVGIQPSAIMGCQFNTKDSSADKTISVYGGNYVGGIAGSADGAYITKTCAMETAEGLNDDYLNELPMWKWNNGSAPDVAEQSIIMNGLYSVTAENDYVGGVSGFLGGASIGGLLNDTLGLGRFIGFTVDGVTVNGSSDFSVKSSQGEYAGGAVGMGIGGTIKNAILNSISMIESANEAGGFVGAGGPGSLASVGETGGLTINLLGLNHLLTINNLLNVIPGVELKIDSCQVNGVGLVVKSSGSGVPETDYSAGGFIAKSNSTKITNSHVTNLHVVQSSDLNGFAGGFVGVSKTGDLADLGDSIKDENGQLIAIDSLLGAVGTMIPEYTNCTVSYSDEQDDSGVTADFAGGFAGDFQSGTVDNSTYTRDGQLSPFAIYDIDYVNGQSYAGGFGGKIYSGALATAGKGISILGGLGASINIGDLLSVVEAYVPIIRNAGVKSDGFTVYATTIASDDSNSSSAGGFAGYVSGAQISNCDVDQLKYTKVTEPTELESVDAGEYFADSQSSYAVTGGRYAGGYIGKIDIGSAASVGKSLNVLNLINIENVLNALNVVTTTIEHSDVYGQAGGYAVRASVTDGDKGLVGQAGGYAGGLYGGHIQDSNAHNFSYIIGQETAGGYIGEMQPGSVASVMDEDSGLLGKIITIDGGLVSLLKTFIPTIRNSSTDSVPCGGVVRADAFSIVSMQKGIAGGYVGHNEGGQVLGLDTSRWLTDEVYNGPTSVCKAERIRSVYGAEFAGGYTGFMEAADMADAGTIKILSELVSVNHILGALSIVYPIQKNTAVYGPLANLTVEEWNNWVNFVGVTGGYGFELAQAGTVKDQSELDDKLDQYIYGYAVVSGRSGKGEVNLENRGGDAGGYVGLMRSGVLSNSMAYDVREVKAWHSAGGYAGSLETGGATSLGGIRLLGIDVNLGDLIDLAQFMVPAIRNSSVYGYKSGMTVQSTGVPDGNTSDIGFAGGYAGSAYGAQIQITDDDVPDDWNTATSEKYAQPIASCDVKNLRRVNGTNAIGGYVGLASAASTAEVNTHSSDGLIQGLLDKVIGSVGDLINVLPLTVTRINKAEVSAADTDWGFVVDGAYSGTQADSTGTVTKYASYAGGFAGKAEAAFLGYDADEKNTTYTMVNGLRQVDGDLYAGGFIGLGDVNGAAEVGSGESETSILDKLLGILDVANLDQITAAGILRTYIRNAQLNGTTEGYRVTAHANPEKNSNTGSEGAMSSVRYKGVAGGFAGAVMNGTIQNSKAMNLSNVKAANYTGGFIGHMGKSGLVDAPGVDLLNKLVGLDAGVADLFGTQVEDCGVYGIPEGIMVEAFDGEEPIAGGFAGYADLGRITNCHVGEEKYDDSSLTDQSTRMTGIQTGGLNKVMSDQIAGGFVGKTDMAYLVSLEANSPLVNALLNVINGLLDLLFVGDLQDLGVIDIDFGEALTVHLLSDGETLGVTLLGLDISVKLIDKSEDGKTGTAVITIGDSEIRLDCTEGTDITSSNLQNVTINLIKGNRTEIDGSTVTGITQGYDVYAGGSGYADSEASQQTDLQGSAGGFVGYNHEGKISNSKMELCDVVKGTKDYVGPFTGYNDLRSAYAFNTIKNIEGENNKYSIYREANNSLQQIVTASKVGIANAVTDESLDIAYNRYDIGHVTSFEGLSDATQNGVLGMFEALNGALESAFSRDGDTRALNAYMLGGSKAVLMLDKENPDNPETIVPEPGEMADPCSEKVDITIQKIWDDWFNMSNERPDEITLRIYQHKFTFDEDGKIQEINNPIEGQTSLGCGGSLYRTLKMTEADKEGFWASTWRTVLEDAPVVEYQDSNNDGVPDTDENGKEIITAYYVYTVEEEAVSGYTTTYDQWDNMHPLKDDEGNYDWDISADDYELTITNKKTMTLPDAGGFGDFLFVLAGVGIVLIGLRRRKKNGVVTDGDC